MKRAVLKSLSLAMLAVVGLTNQSLAFAGIAKVPSAIQTMHTPDMPLEQTQKAKLALLANGSSVSERPPLSLRLGNRPHLFDGYFLCESEAKLSPVAGLVDFSD